ncbi:MAG: vacuolar family H+-ATPase subunit H [Lachnospiraceae bacterium]|nr:vacuolar family H+-ATPase subunit H [Lachnospiraceae bacterium]
MSSKFEQMIDDIEDYIHSCKNKPLSNQLIIVNKDEILDMLQDLRQKTPVEISRYQKVISNKEAILNDARQKAEALIDEAAKHTNQLVSESEIMQQAYAQAQEIVEMASAQAQEIVDKANEEAYAMRMAAVSYTDDNLASIENVLSHGIDVAATNYERLMTQLQESIQVIQSNRTQLYPAGDNADDGSSDKSVAGGSDKEESGSKNEGEVDVI